MKREICFTCAVCPNGCRLVVERGESSLFVPKETGRCVRGRLLIGKEFFFIRCKDRENSYIQHTLDQPLTKQKTADLVKMLQDYYANKTDHLEF